MKIIYILLFLATQLAATPPFWEDNFDSFDDSKWAVETGNRHDAYSTGDAVRIEGGQLILNASKKNNTYWAGIVKTKGKFEIESGYVELKVKFGGTINGHWCAAWLYNDDLASIHPHIYKSAFEVDIFERRAYDFNGKDIQGYITSALHWSGYYENRKSLGADSGDRNLGDGWHIYGLEINDSKLIWYIDGEKYWEVERFSEMKKMYLILSVELKDVFQDWTGPLPKDDFEQDIIFVDHVKYWKRKP